MKIRTSLALLLVPLVFWLSACTQPHLSIAERYLAETPEDQIFDYFVHATYILTGNQVGFTSPSAIPSNDLFRFFVLVADDETLSTCFDETEKIYRIPVSTITNELDIYLDGYNFDPSAVISATYDPITCTLESQALGFGTGNANRSFYKANATSDDKVEVEFSDLYSNNYIVTAQISDSGIKFTSCIQTDYSTREK